MRQASPALYRPLETLLGDFSSLRRSVLIGLIAGLFLAFSGAFGTSGLSLGPRLGFWIGVILGGTLFSRMIIVRLVAISALARHPWRLALLFSLIMGVPYTIGIYALIGHMLKAHLTLSQVPIFYAIVVVMTGVMTSLNLMLNRADPSLGTPDHASWERTLNLSPQDAPDTQAITAAPPAPLLDQGFRERLPFRLRDAEIYALSSEDHYLRVHTSAGSELILMRLSDAANLLDGLNGARVHRSWWVARSAITDVQKDGAKITLWLKGDLTVPVSRQQVASLKALGWF